MKNSAYFEDPHQNYRRTRFFIEMGMALAMSGMFLLLLGFLRVPVSIPLFFLTYRRSPKIALYVAIILGYMTLLIHPLILHPIVFIECPLEYACIAIAGFFPMGIKKYENNILQWIYECRGVIIAATLRFLVTFVGSFIIYSYYLHSTSAIVWLIAFLDEGPIFIPYLIFTMVLIPRLVKYKYEIRELK
ncbi:MAG: energy-coupled thiamine transporter ThiT [Firmicutes bacterium]|nr:energy-coupled thiamine transporter ThiT [Bacillota bacterium]